MLRWTARVAGVLLGAVVLMIACAAGYRMYSQHVAASVLAIHGQGGIDEAGFRSIGGMDQWIQVRGEDRSNPVILFLHGGPSVSMIPFTYRAMREWEKQFTIVHWDQRGAGRTYIESRRRGSNPSSSIEQLVSDGIAVAEYARRHLQKQKIVVLGESFGTVIGTEMVRERPDLFYAYVGTGQITSLPQAEALGYRLLIEKVRESGDAKSASKLQRMGPPPYSDAATTAAFQEILSMYAPPSEQRVREGMGRDYLFAPGYSLRDLYDVVLGATRHRDVLLAEEMKYNAMDRGTRFEVPMFFIQGGEDLFAPTELVSDYIEKVRAPRKELVVIPGGGHNSFYGYSGPFLATLVARVRPLSVQAPPQP